MGIPEPLPGSLRVVEAVVIAAIPRFRQVRVCDGDGRHYAITRKTEGVGLASLHEGQRVVCAIDRLGRVVAASPPLEDAEKTTSLP